MLKVPKRITKLVKRLDVIKALKKEPLESASFFHEQYVPASTISRAYQYKPNCNVCAVGAVMRQVSFEASCRKYGIDLNSAGCELTGYITSNFDTDKTPRQVAREGNLMSALSMKFEALCDGGLKMDTVRKHCIKFVKANFPKEFKLTLNTDRV